MAASDRSAGEVEDYRSQMEADLRLAERVHRSMIPRSERRGDLEVVCRFTPMHGVGGDYASVFYQTDTRVVASICDVSGQGIAAALLASRVNSFVLNMAPGAAHPCEVGSALNAFICRKPSPYGLNDRRAAVPFTYDRADAVAQAPGCGSGVR